MKKRLVMFLSAMICASTLFVGCGSSDKTVNKEKPSKSLEEETKTAKDEKKEIEEEEESTTAKTENVDNNKDDDNKGEALSGDYINYDNMQFSIDGKTYTLGKTTLRELIDAGVPFDETDIANAENNLNSNTQSGHFRINLGEYWSAQVFVMNDSSENKVTADCYINEIYLPVHDDETQDIITFAFPSNMTEDELKQKAGEPTKFDTFEDGDYVTNMYEYKKESTKYYRDWGYSFDFTNGVLKYITLDYLP